MKKLLMFAAFAAAAMFAACDDDDTTSNDTSANFYQSLSADYNYTTNQTLTGANFNRKNADGENIILAGNQSIVINGKLPVYANVSPYYYTLTLPGIEDVTFVFTREKGEVYTNTASAKEVKAINIPADFTAINGGGTTVLTWTGDPVGKDETITVRVLDEEGVAYGTFYQRDLNATSIDLTFTAPVPVTEKTATVTVSRVLERPLTQTNGDAGGIMKVAYTVEKTVNVQ